MREFDYQRAVIAYHGCDESIASGVLLRGEKLKISENAHDWLGKGIYFWEHGPQRAFEWARNRARRRGKIKKPAVLGALINLGCCFDLLDTRNTALLPEAYNVLSLVHKYTKDPLPANQQAKGDDGPDLVLRYLDCAVINLAIEMRERKRARLFIQCAVVSPKAAVLSGVPKLCKNHTFKSRSEIQMQSLAISAR